MGKKKRNKSAQAGGSGAAATEIRQVSPARPQGYSVVQTSKPNFFTGSIFEWLAIAVTSLLGFWFLTARIVGVQVSVLADEYLYVLDAHYNGLADAKYPNYLFQLIYSNTKMCGAEFYACARSINAFFVIFGAVFVYFLAKQIGRSKWLGALAGVSTILGSYGTYTAYFMPEAIFNGLIMVFFWALFRFGNSKSLWVLGAIGTTLGVASLAKPHGLFVVPAILIFLVLWTRATRGNWFIQAVIRSVVFVSSVVGAKSLLGFLLAGERALPLFGMYGTLGTATQTATETIAAATGDGTSVFFTAWGQILMVTMILGLGFPVAVQGLLLSFKKDPEVFEAVKFRSAMGLSLLSLMPAIAIFEAWQNLGPWMHTRYYAYLIPLALIALIEAYVNYGDRIWAWAKYVVVVVFLGLSGFNLVTAAIPYSSNWIDGPDFRMHMDNIVLSSISTLIAMVLAVLWIWKTRAAMASALVVTLVLAVVSGSHTTNFLKTTFGYESPYEHLARVLSGYIPQNELDRAVIIGQFEMIQRTVFSAQSGGIEIRHPVDVLSRSDVDPAKAWLITIGDQVVEGFGEPMVSNPGYKLYSIDPSNSLKPRIHTIEDFSNPCPSSSDSGWACGAETSLSLTSPFPRNTSLDLMFEVSDGLAGKELEFVLGDATVVGSFDAGIAGVFAKLPNTGSSEVLTIRLKSPDNDSSFEGERFIKPIWGYSRATIGASG
jgi:phosphoglycerol transferase